MLAGLSKNSKRSFLATFFVCCYDFMYRYFKMFVNCERILFVAALAGCFLKILNKQACLLKKNYVRQNAFHPEMKYLNEKYCPSHAEIPPGRGRTKNVLASYKRNSISCLISSVFPSRLLSRPGSYIHSPLVMF